MCSSHFFGFVNRTSLEYDYGNIDNLFGNFKKIGIKAKKALLKNIDQKQQKYRKNKIAHF